MNPDKAFQAYKQAVEHNDYVAQTAVRISPQTGQNIDDILNESRFWLDYLAFRHKQGKYLSPKNNDQ